MNKILAISAVALVAVVMGLSVVAPMAMAMGPANKAPMWQIPNANCQFVGNADMCQVVVDSNHNGICDPDAVDIRPDRIIPLPRDISVTLPECFDGGS